MKPLGISFTTVYMGGGGGHPNLTTFVPLLSHTIISLGHIMMTSSSIMVIVIKEEHYLVDASAMMSSELGCHCTFILFY